MSVKAILQGQSLSNTFDLVIHTQAEFEAMYASSTWLGAKSVCFIGDGGTTAFTRSDGMGLKIPQSVMNLQGLNGAKISVTDFSYNSSTNKAALWYETQPDEDAGYWIDGLEVKCTGTGTGYGFYFCTQLTNCTGTGTGTGAGIGTGTGTGFHSCTQLTNCTGTGYGYGYGTSPGTGTGFHSCTQLTNCTGTSTGVSPAPGAGTGAGFHSCTQLTNCTGTSTSPAVGIGFHSCTQLTNCTGTGTGAGYGYGFYNCSWVNGCKQGETASTTALFYDCSNVDPFTCEDQLNNGVTGQVLTKTEDGQEWADSAGGGAFDLVIRTQAEFEAMYSSSTWLDAKSVCFIGDGGTTAFTRSDGMGLKIPQTVMNLQGLNGAKISVTDFSYNNSTNKAALWYETQPDEDAGYWIDGLEVKCTGTATGYGFYFCTQLTNCTGTGFYSCTQLTNCTGTGTSTGFYSCTQLTNCTGTGTSPAVGIGFHSCTQLTNCTGTGTGSGANPGVGTGFHLCTQLTNCTGTGTGANPSRGTGFHSCTQLTNCTGTGTGTGFHLCTQLTNCTAPGTGTGTGFYSCKWVNGCNGSDLTTFTGGTMLYVDTATVVAS